MSNTVEEARKTRKGTVTSTAMDKTITVDIEREFEHPLYVKRIRRNSNMKVHDEDEVADPGDIVRIVETRPQSKTKRWRLDEILVKQEEQALEIEAEDEETESAEVDDTDDQDNEDDEPADVEADEETDTTEE